MNDLSDYSFSSMPILIDNMQDEKRILGGKKQTTTRNNNRGKGEEEKNQGN